MKARILPFCLLYVGMLAACAGDAKPTSDTNAGAPAQRTAVDFEEPPDLGGRKRSRLSAEQVRDSLRVATGEPWTAYEIFAETMGRPDYLEVTADNLEPSVPFARMLEEGAREVCARALQKDVSTDPMTMRPSGEPKVLLRHASVLDSLDGNRAAVLRNLKYLLLRFHGTKIEADDDPRLTPWLEFLGGLKPGISDVVGNGVRWGYLCVGLVTHPNFVTY